MKIHGHFQNGVVVLDEQVALPEGAKVVVSVLGAAPSIRETPIRKRAQLPLVKSDRPGSLTLTNDRIAEILDGEDIEAMRRQWHAPS